MDREPYDVLIITTAKDFLRVSRNYHKLTELIPARQLIFIGSDEVGRLSHELNFGEKVGFINENDILPFDEVNNVMKTALGIENVPRGVTGWYYQQFLKMQYSAVCQDKYYLVWDGDTIPCRKLSMFNDESMLPFFDLKTEYHEEYFNTLAKLLPGMHKCIQPSFISEHMLMNCDIMQNMIHDIEENEDIAGERFYEKIIYSISRDKLDSNSFSEFETYGTYTCFRYLNSYRLREWHSFRYGGYFFEPDTITDEDFEWLGRDFDAISFEKGHTVREDHRDIFTKKEYREKLSARQILEIAQQEFKEGFKEVWSDK
jgi:hypothetical protein